MVFTCRLARYTASLSSDQTADLESPHGALRPAELHDGQADGPRERDVVLRIACPVERAAASFTHRYDGGAAKDSHLHSDSAVRYITLA
jgi:hypothetical protein